MRTDAGVFEGGAPPEVGITPDFVAELGEKKYSASQSGHERNHLFLSDGGRQFVDVSGVAGVDHPGDGRAFAVWDYDRDGWLDLAVTNANAPLLVVYRNQLGDAAGGHARGAMIALRFVGANHAAAAASGVSNRDGYGATASVALGQVTVVREHRCGEGFAAQNSATMIIGIGDRDGADSVVVRWPSGVELRTGHVPAGTLLTVYENAVHSPSGESFVAQPYAVPGRVLAPPPPLEAKQLRLSLPQSDEPSQLLMFTSMATWCASCRAELPVLAHLRRSFDTSELRMLGVPVSDLDDAVELRDYVAAQTPAYELLHSLTNAEVAAVQELLRAEIPDGLPATIVTDTEGRVLLTRLGAPTVSELRALLRR